MPIELYLYFYTLSIEIRHKKAAINLVHFEMNLYLIHHKSIDLYFNNSVHIWVK